MDYFLGLDCSTQSLTAVFISRKGIIKRLSVNYDEDLPQFQTMNGVYIHEDGKTVHSNPLMWVEALELLFSIFIDTDMPLEDIKAISGSGQQHGTIYLNQNFEKSISTLDDRLSLKDQLRGSFSRETSPIWMDSSTNKQCKEIRESLGGKEATIKITGSDTFERFSGPQIRKFYQENKIQYEKTVKIHLVSSFMSSILLGANSPIDHGDGAGMNLMNIATKKWDERAINATAPGLLVKLPPLTNSYSIIGNLSNYFVKKYGFSPETLILPWSGDNPNSLIGVGLTEKGKAAISLGTSDTYFAYMENLSLDLKGEGNVFGAPTGDYMSLICYKNGSLARENIKDMFNLNWTEFSEILLKTPPGNYGKIMLPYFFPEIVPLVLEPKVYRFGFDENDLEGNVRAIVEAQVLSMKLHSEWIEEAPKAIYTTGGASANEAILQIIADVFNTPVRKFELTNSASLGAAIRCIKSYYDSVNKIESWSMIIDKFIKQESDTIEPRKKNSKIYSDMVDLYKKYENFILNNGDNPENLRMDFTNKHFKS